MACGCKNKGNQSQPQPLGQQVPPQPQPLNQVQPQQPQQTNNQNIQESIKKVVEKYYRK
jgi:hypothetical protein